jgi:hypothetical protein
MRAAGHESALVFGNSGGAIISLEMAKSQPLTVVAVEYGRAGSKELVGMFDSQPL